MCMRIVRFILVLVLMTICTMAYSQSPTIRSQHKVEKSETVFGIAKRYGITIEELIAVNPEMKQQGYELKRGDKVVTAGGIYGIVDEIKERSVLIKVDGDVKLRVDKNSIVRDFTEDAPKA